VTTVNVVLERSIQCRNFATPATNASSDANKHSFITSKKVETVDNTIGYILSKNARTSPYGNAFRSPHQNTNYSHSALKVIFIENT
jgi:hypothetical protein